MSSVKPQCQFNVNGGTRQCLNNALENSQYCSPHSKKAFTYTPMRQRVFRSGGALDLGPRLAKERDYQIPVDSAGIDGYPYTTVRDLEAYRSWKSGQSRISTTELLDRFPLDVRDKVGYDINGDEIAIYDSFGTVWSLAKDADGGNIILEESTDLDGSTTTLYQTETGYPFAVISSQLYQLVYLDEDILKRSIISIT